ncbi:MAG: hypothetical protein PVF68_05995 [Acidobacteriota bacterium]
MSILKRQREVKKREKAARKRAKRHGAPGSSFQEPRTSPLGARLLGHEPPDEEESDHSSDR